MTQPGWKISARYGLPTSAPPPEDVDLALAEVDPAGTIVRVGGPGRQRWGWKEGERVPDAMLRALGAVPVGGAQALPMQQGGLSLLGLPLAPGRGWLLIGYAVEALAAASTFKSLIEKVPVLVLRMRADGTVLHADTDTEAVTGYPPEKILGRPFWLDVVHPEDRWKLTEALRHSGEAGSTATVGVRFLTPRQELRLARLYLFPAAGQAEARIEALVFDVTEQAEIEAALLQSEALYRTFLEQSPMGILHLDATGIVTFENHPFRQIVGEAAEDAWIGRRLEDIPGLDARLEPLVERMLHRGQPIQGEALTYRRAGVSVPAHLVVHGSPIRHPGGQIVGGVMMIEDVTEQHQREEELLLRDRYERAEVALREAVLADLNEDVFLHEAAEILGETTQADRIHLLVHVGTEGHAVTRAAWVHHEQDEPFSLSVHSAEFPALRAAVVGGHSLWLRAGAVSDDARGLLALTEAEEVLWAPFYDTGRLGGFVLFERLRLPAEASVGFWLHAEQRLMDRLVRLFETLWSWIQVGQRYRLTVATIDDCLFTFTFARAETRRYLFITPQIQALTGYGADEVLARSDAAWSWIDTLVHPEDRAALREHDEALRNGRERRVTYRVLQKSGAQRWLCEHATPHRDATGRVTVTGILMDVTEQKDAEEILLSAREQVESASRLKNTFVATMSHELRTPLGAINGFAELLAHELSEWEAQTGQPLPPQVREFTEAVRQNARRVLHLADDLFMLSNTERGTLRLDRRPVPLQALVRRCAGKIAVGLSEKDVTLEVDLDATDPAALGDAQRIEQVLDNVLSNAAKFTDRGRVALRTRRAGADVVIEVADTGTGIDPEYLGRLFTPFLQEDSRLNRRFEGTGLGLALVKRLLDLMGGRIEVESQKGKGSTFRIFLPAAG